MQSGRPLVAAALVLAGGIGAAAVCLTHYNTAYTWVEHTSDVRIVLGEALGRATGSNTHDEATCRAIAQNVDRFATLTADNPAQQANAAALQRAREAACAGQSAQPLVQQLAAADGVERDLMVARRATLASARTWTILALVLTALAALGIVALARRSLHRALRRMTESEARYRELAEKYEAISITDELTGLHNRRGFLLLGEQEYRLARREGVSVAVLFADLDGLKAINDEHGHDEGDRALVAFAALLRSTLRTSDVVARIGGDEFVALAYDVDADAARVLRDRLHAAIAAHRETGTRFKLAASMGWVIAAAGEQRTFEQLVEQADAEMYEHKRERREARAAGRATMPVIPRG